MDFAHYNTRAPCLASCTLVVKRRNRRQYHLVDEVAPANTGSTCAGDNYIAELEDTESDGYDYEDDMGCG